jgi:hypothetical protein
MPRANPVQVVSISPTKAYVLRFDTSSIAVIDPSQVTPNGVPTKIIDLSALVLPDDGDHGNEPSGAVFDSDAGRVYVVLGNIDQTKIPTDGSGYQCGSVRSSLIAIDAATDAVVSLGGTGLGGGITLQTHNPISGQPVIFDKPRGRVLLLGAGCNNPSDAGASAGAIQMRGIEEVNLTTRATNVLLTLTDPALFPRALDFVSLGKAYVGFYGSTYNYDPTQAMLGSLVMGAPDTYAVDVDGQLFGPRSSFGADGGPGPVEVVRVPLSGSAVVLATHPFMTETGGFLSGAAMITE